MIGSKDSVHFDQIDFHETAPAASYVEEKIRIKNLSSRRVIISIPSNLVFDINSTQLELNPHDSSELSLKVIIPAGATDEKIQMKSAEWIFGLGFHSFGYHLTNADFDLPGRKQLPSRLFFHRISDEYELEIASIKISKG